MLTVGERIAAALLEARMQQRELAARLGVTPRTVQRWVNVEGAVPRERLPGIAQETGKPLSYFLDAAAPSPWASAPADLDRWAEVARVI